MMKAGMKAMLIFSPGEKESGDRAPKYFNTLGVNVLRILNT